MGRRCKNNRIEVTEDNVADVVSMMTGIPVNPIAQTESNKLITRTIESKVIGQREAVLKLLDLFKEIAGLKDPNRLVSLFS
jgi:ATP-dependent Clp protease ATP-binding subunit ClpC